MIHRAFKAMKDVEIEMMLSNILKYNIFDDIKGTSKPSIIDVKKTGIAKGSGRKIEEVNQLIKQFESNEQMMKMIQDPMG